MVNFSETNLKCLHNPFLNLINDALGRKRNSFINDQDVFFVSEKIALV